MLVWGHWRLGKNRLCIYPFLSSFSQLLVSVQFWKHTANVQKKKLILPSESGQMPLCVRHTQDVYLTVLIRGGHNLLDTATLGSEHWARPAAFKEFVSKKSGSTENLILPPAACFNTHFVILFPFLPTLSLLSFSLCLLASFIPSLSVPLRSLLIDSA